MVDDDPMRDDHHKHWESPHHHRVEYEVCKLLKIVTLIIISIIREYLKKVSVKVKVTSPKMVAKQFDFFVFLWEDMLTCRMLVPSDF